MFYCSLDGDDLERMTNLLSTIIDVAVVSDDSSNSDCQLLFEVIV